MLIYPEMRNEDKRLREQLAERERERTKLRERVAELEETLGNTLLYQSKDDSQPVRYVELPVAYVNRTGNGAIIVNEYSPDRAFVLQVPPRTDANTVPLETRDLG